MDEVVEALLTAGDVAGAFKAVQGGEKGALSPGLAAHLLEMALSGLGQGVESDIESLFLDVESRFDLEKLNALALLAEKYQKPRVGIAICYRSIWRHFNQSVLHHLLSRLLSATGAELVSIHHARVAVALEPQSLGHRLHLSRLLAKNSKPLEASAAFLDAIAYLESASDVLAFMAALEEETACLGLFPLNVDLFIKLNTLCLASRNWRLLHLLIEMVLRQDDLHLKVVAHAELAQWWNDGETWRNIWPRIAELRRRISRQIAERAHPSASLATQRKDGPVLFLLSTFQGNVHHPVLRFVLDTAVSLAARNRDVYVMVTDEVGSSRRSGGSAACSAAHQELIEEYYEAAGVRHGVRMVYVAPPDKNENYVEEVCATIRGLAPSVALTYHQAYENSFIFADFVRALCPLVYQQTNRLQDPGFKADLYLSCASDIDFARQSFPEPEKWRYQQTGFTPFKQRATYTREELGIGPRCLVLVTVGNRLQGEVGRSMLDAMLQLVASDVDFEWWLLGVGSSEAINAFRELSAENRDKLQKAMRFRPFEVHLRAFYEHVDVYVNPRRAGGGFSIMLAVSESVPVVSFAGTDVDRVSAGHFVTDEADYAALLMKLARDDDARRQVGHEMRQAALSIYDPGKAARAFLDAFDVARDGRRAEIESQFEGAGPV